MFCFRFLKFTPLKDLPGKEVEELQVGDYGLTSEVSRTNRTLYYVVKILDVLEDSYNCEWYYLKNEEKLFVKLDANWVLFKESVLTLLDKPVEIDAGRRGRLLFKDVYKFLVGKEFEM